MNDQTPFGFPYLSPRELQAGGYLQEVNRRFFHPLGLALGLILHEDPRQDEIHVLDGRDDPEGFFMSGKNADLLARATLIRVEEEKRGPARKERLGYWIQPVR